MSSGTIDAEVRELVGRAQQGDGEAFARLYDRYVDQVFGYIIHRVRDRHLAEDLTSDVFVRALRGLDGFAWRGVDLGAWLVTIARNRIADHFKSARARLERPVEEIHDQPEVETDPASSIMAEDVARSLHEAMGELSDDHREVLHLRFNQGFSVAETATIMQRTDGAVKALQYRALRSLADIVKRDPRFTEEGSW